MTEKNKEEGKRLICPKCKRFLTEEEIDCTEEKLAGGTASFRCDVCELLWPFGHDWEEYE